MKLSAIESGIKRGEPIKENNKNAAERESLSAALIYSQIFFTFLGT